MGQENRGMRLGSADKLDESNFEDTGNELRSPPFQDILLPHNLIPLILFFIIFRILSHYVKKYTWQSVNGFRLVKFKGNLYVEHFWNI